VKRLLFICGLLNMVLGPLAAQSFSPTAYEEESFAAFAHWRENYSGEEPRKIKIPVRYFSTDGENFNFKDLRQEEELAVGIYGPWPEMTRGQEVTIYLTAQGPWVWDRELDAIDYGNGRLVQAEDAAVLAQEDGQRGTTGRAESPRQRAPSGIDYGTAPRVGVPRTVVRILGETPVQGRYYRLQIGSYSIRGNASRTAGSLKNAGLNPAFEAYDGKVRVVIIQIPGEEVVETAQKIGNAGFSEVWCREEP
jgi:hypothetical protein